MTEDDGAATNRPRIVVAKRDPCRAPAATVVVGFDRDAVSQAALAVGADLAGRLAARVVVVHVVNLGDYPIDPESLDWEQQAQQTLTEERRIVEQVLADHPFGFRYEARHGSPVHALVSAAEAHDALLIVVGRHGSGVSENLRRLLAGSVSRQLVKAAARPVLVVPHA